MKINISQSVLRPLKIKHLIVISQYRQIVDYTDIIIIIKTLKQYCNELYFFHLKKKLQNEGLWNLSV